MTEENKEETPNLPIKPQSPLERVKVAFLVHLGDAYLISEELNMSLPEVNMHLKEIRKSEQDPNQLTADNVAMWVISGINMRMYHLHKQLKAINGRDQMWRSACCHDPVEEVPATPGTPATDTTPEILPTPAFKRCLGCKKECRVELLDYPTIYRIRNETMRSIREEITLYIHTLKELNIVAEQPKYTQNVKQDILIIGGQQQDYLKLGPMEMDRLLNDLKKEIVKMDEEIQKDEAEIAEREAEIVKEEAKGGAEKIDVGGAEKAAGGVQRGEGEKTPGTGEEKG